MYEREDINEALSVVLHNASEISLAFKEGKFPCHECFEDGVQEMIANILKIDFSLFHGGELPKRWGRNRKSGGAPVDDNEHSPVYRTMQALENEGLHVAVAYHHKRPGPPFDDMVNGQARVDQWTREAFEDGAKWVSVVVVSDKPVKERLTQDE